MCGEGWCGYGESRGEDALFERRREGDFPATPTEPLCVVACRHGGDGAGWVYGSEGGERGVLHGVVDGGSEYVGGSE